jgi:hypothetical protein
VTKTKGIRAADDLMRRLVQVPKSAVSKPKKRRKKKK